MAYIGRTPTNAALTASDLADGIVSSGKIAADAVTSAKIADNAVVTAAINADAVTDAKIADDVVGTEHLTANEVDTTALGADAVTGAQLADDAVNSEHYTDGSIDTAHLADGQVTTAKLATAVFTGATDIGAGIADADLFLMDDGAGGTIRKTAASRFKTYIGGGITGADQWRLTANFSGSASTIQSNLERVDTDSYGVIGSAMTVSSGIFTFPTTGIWRIEATFFTVCNGANRAHAGGMSTTTNNSSFSDTAGNYSSMFNSSNDTYANSSCSFIFDVTNTTTHKVKFYVSTDNSSSVTGGNSDSNNTAFTFIRLGDT